MNWLAFKVLADQSAAASSMQSYVAPVVQGMCVLASLVCVFFLVNGGIHYMTSTGQPDKLEHAKRMIRNALLGLVVVIAAGTITAIFANAWHQSGATVTSTLPSLNAISPDKTSGGIVGVILDAITGILNDIIQSVAAPFLKALSDFTNATPLISDNSSVFNLWLTIVGITDVIFVVVVGLLGFHLMSASTFGIEEIEFKHMLPQIGLIFLLANSSVFLIDGLISFSNAMIHAMHLAFGQITVWNVLTNVAKGSGGYGLAALLIMMTFLILAVVLLVYYVGRIVMIYLGAVLSPLVLLIWLLPSFRDFARTAAKVYAATIFVLFVHVVILELAASLFTGMIATSPNHLADPLMSMIVGVAALIALLKTQSFMMQLSYVSMGPRSIRKLGTEFISGISYLNQGRKYVNKTVSKHSSKSEEPGASGNGSSKSKGSANHSISNYKQPAYRNITTNKSNNRPATGTARVAPKKTSSSISSAKSTTKKEKML